MSYDPVLHVSARMNHHQALPFYNNLKNGKVIPLQARCGPEGG